MFVNAKKWREAGHWLKRALLGPTDLNLLGTSYKVCYETRTAWLELDYPILQQLARRQSCIIDVGANKGITSLLMSSVMDSAGIIHAFEASEEACRVLHENVLLNGLEKKIEVINAVVSERPGRVVEFLWNSSSVFASVAEASGSSEKRTGSMRKATVTLDDYCTTQGIRPSLVKIDVEGAERQVIRGMRTILSDLRPMVFVEVHTLTATTLAENCKNILIEARNTRYKMCHLASKQIFQDCTFLEGKHGRTFVLLIPHENDIPDWLPSFDTSKIP